MTNETIKGFRDYIGEEAQKRAEIKKLLAETFEKYGFEPAETPVIEAEEFVRGENPNDEAVSDIYKLEDKGKRKLALRYEFTFQLKRLMQNKKLPYKRYQIGEVFRDEPVSANRLRQFIQCDVDTIGSTIKDDAEILALTKDVLDKLGIKFKIYIGNRALLNEILEELGIKNEQNQILREIDKLGKLSEKEIRENLNKYKAEKFLDILKKPEKYFEKYKSYEDISELKKYCKYYGVEIIFQPSLVRGLSYYKKNVFEVKTEQLKGNKEISSNSPKRGQMKETICGGGSYVFNGIQSTGISFGVDRLSSLAKMNYEKDKYLVISLNQDAEAIKLAEKLRAKGELCMIYYGKPSKSLEYANSYKFSKVIFVGEEEIKSKKFKIKDMGSGKESILKI